MSITFPDKITSLNLKATDDTTVALNATTGGILDVVATIGINCVDLRFQVGGQPKSLYEAILNLEVAVTDNTAGITDEAATAAAATLVVATDLATEVARAAAVSVDNEVTFQSLEDTDGLLDDKITTLEASITTTNTNLSADIAAEATRADLAEKANTAGITTEAATAAAATLIVATDLATEVARAGTVETTIFSMLAEYNFKVDYNKDLADAAFTAEALRADTAEKANAARILALETALDLLLNPPAV